MKKIIRYFSLLIGLTTSFSSLAKEKISLMLDWYVNPDHAAIIVAQQKGFFEKNIIEFQIFTCLFFVLVKKMDLMKTMTKKNDRLFSS